MGSDTKLFRDYLAYYGSDIETWPEHARILGRRLQREEEVSSLIENERRFERLMHERVSEPAADDLASRIIAKARLRQAKPLPKRPQRWFSELVATVNPAALAATLLLGVALGFGSYSAIPRSGEDSALQFNADDDGTAP